MSRQSDKFLTIDVTEVICERRISVEGRQSVGWVARFTDLFAAGVCIFGRNFGRELISVSASSIANVTGVIVATMRVCFVLPPQELLALVTKFTFQNFDSEMVGEASSMVTDKRNETPMT